MITQYGYKVVLYKQNEMTEKYLLVSKEVFEKIFTEFRELKKLLVSDKDHIRATPPHDELMDTADLIQYMKLDRRTIYNYRKNRGLPAHKNGNGKIFYWKSEIDSFFGKYK